MARVSATASLGCKLNLANKKAWGQYDNVNTNHSITIERTYPDDMSDEELLEKGSNLHDRCNKFVEAQVAQDFKDARKAE